MPLKPRLLTAAALTALTLGTFLGDAPEASAATPVGTRVVCHAPVVRVRAAPSRSAAIRGTVKEGQRITGRREGTWLRLGEGRWMAAYYACAPSATKRPAAPVRKVPAKRFPAPISSAMRQSVSTNGSPTSPFGPRRHPISGVWAQHSGIDIGAACRAPVTAAHHGVVTRAGWSSSGGWTVVVNHGRMGQVATVESKYLHLAAFSVRVGQKVQRGQVIGRVGATGSATKCHLHFGTYQNGRAVDPQRYVGRLNRLTAY